MLVGYARVSTTDQTLDLQHDALTKAGCTKIFTDTASGAQTEREGLTEAISYVRAGDTLGFPPGSGGFANEPEHPRRRIWQKGEADVGSRRNSRRRRSSDCWMAVRGCRRWPPNSG